MDFSETEEELDEKMDYIIKNTQPFMLYLYNTFTLAQLRQLFNARPKN